MAALTAAEEAEHIGIWIEIELSGQRKENRNALLETFQELLLSEHGVEWDHIFGQKLLDPEEVSCWLVAYSRGLHAAGNAYNKYSVGR